MLKRLFINLLLISIFTIAMTAVTLPFAAQLRVNSARQLTRSGLLKEAQKSYEEALAFAPTDSDYWLEYGDFLWDVSVLTDNDRLSERVASAYRMATEVNPNCARCWVNRGHIAFADGKVDQAITFFRQAKRLDPNGGDTAFYLRKAALNLIEEDEKYSDVANALAGEDVKRP